MLTENHGSGSMCLPGALHSPSATTSFKATLSPSHDLPDGLYKSPHASLIFPNMAMPRCSHMAATPAFPRRKISRTRTTSPISRLLPQDRRVPPSSVPDRRAPPCSVPDRWMPPCSVPDRRVPPCSVLGHGGETVGSMGQVLIKVHAPQTGVSSYTLR